MIPILAFSLLLLAADPPDSPWVEVRLTIFRDPYSSSDQVTVCRVRADNQGSRTWSGRALAFEARAVGGGRHAPGAGPVRPRARAPRIARDAHLAARPPRPLRGRPDHAEGLVGRAGAEACGARRRAAARSRRPERARTPKVRVDWIECAVHEDPRRGRGRARACPVLVAAPKPPRRGDLLRAGQPRHRRGRRLPAGFSGRHRRDRRPGRDPPRGPDGRRAGAAALARDRRRVRQARPADLRTDAPGGADRVVEGVLQGVLPAPQHPDGRGERLPDRRGGAQGHQEVRLPGRAQGGRPRRRQGRAHHRERRGRRAGAAPVLPGARLRRRGRPDHRRGVPARAGVLVPRALRRRGRPFPCRRRATTRRSTTATAARTPAAWARTRPPAS